MLLFLYGYGDNGEPNPLEDQGVSRWAVTKIWSSSKGGADDKMARQNTSRSLEEAQGTPSGFNMTRELIRLNPGIFSALPREFLPNYKNPCWFEKVNETDVGSQLRDRLVDNGTGHFRLRCLPYFYIIGMPKCGTTDLYYRITEHPDVVGGPKEPHWWAKNRRHLLGDGSPSTIWCNNRWRKQQWDTPNNEPPILVADLLRAVQPHAKFILTLRNPTERLYSEYLFFSGGFRDKKSVTDFHERATLAIDIFQSCLKNNTVRSCTYDPNLPPTRTVRLRLGLYEVYLRDWLSVFPRDQILVQRLEDHSKDPHTTMTRVFKFLDLGPITNQSDKDAIFMSNAKRSQKKRYDSIGQMLPKTRRMLNKFYRPYNQRLAELLNDTDYLWLEKSSV
ncbi:CHST15 [Branchiostoma lanceolatum]|uniref:Sulfotransferase n=1 Tax=Branchiostoma lanceolatum TaxID=7740 RepID=A0A8J9V8G6_BRALA|nr:CHST15 [Branchiostoma lanceolatum]